MSGHEAALFVDNMAAGGCLAGSHIAPQQAGLRNKLAHEYPTRPERQAERLNEAFAAAPRLLDVLAGIEAHCRSKGLPT